MKGAPNALLYSNISQVGIKEAEEILSPAAFSALRFTIAALCFTPVLKGAFADKRVRNKGFELAVYLFFGYIFQSVGLSMTTASRSAVTATFYILTVPFLVGMTGRRIPRSTWIAAAVAVMGVVVLESDPAQVRTLQCAVKERVRTWGRAVGPS